MAVWLARAGRDGEFEQLALDNNVAIVQWSKLPDLSSINTREELFLMLKSTYPSMIDKALKNWESQLWPFIKVISKGDLIALPLKRRASIAIGEVTGDYVFRKDLSSEAGHTRPVKWIGEYPRTAFDQDLLYSLGAFMTVCRIERNNAEDRIRALVGKKLTDSTKSITVVEAPIVVDEAPDFEQNARDQISSYISRKFAGHDFAHLVSSILLAQGYQVHESPAGPDGGVDIIAGRGPLGFDPPRLAVQVKSGTSPVDVKIIREMQGVMNNFGAEHALIVSWGGFNKVAFKEAARAPFSMKLWDSEDVVRMLQTYYDQLPDDIKAELPLKRIWVLIPSEE